MASKIYLHLVKGKRIDGVTSKSDTVVTVSLQGEAVTYSFLAI